MIGGDGVLSYEQSNGTNAICRKHNTHTFNGILIITKCSESHQIPARDIIESKRKSFNNSQ